MALDKDFIVKNGLQVPDGSAASPSVTFSSDLNSGLFSNGADNLGLSAGGSVRLNLSATATTSYTPFRAFSGGNASSPAFSFDGDTDLGMYRESTDVLALSAGGQRVLRLTSSQTQSGFSGSSSSPAFSFAIDPNTGIYRIGEDNLGFSAGGSSVLSLTSSSILPKTTLMHWDATNTHISSAGHMIFNMDSNDNGSADFFVWAKDRVGDSGGTELMRLDEDGKLGIGVSPSVVLDVSSTATNIASFASEGGGSNDKKLNFLSGADRFRINAEIASTNAATALAFDIAGSEAMRIDASGNVGIGVTPVYQLDVEQAGGTGSVLRASNSNSNFVQFALETELTGDTNTSLAVIRGVREADGNSTLSFRTGTAGTASEVMNLDSAGNLQLNNYGAGTLVTDASGNVTVSAGGGSTFADGSAASPSITFTNDLDTGLYSSSADSLDITAGGVRRANFNTGGLRIRSGDILNQNGSAGAPAYGFLNDVNSGLFSGGADIVGISTGGTERLNIGATGNITVNSGQVFAPDGSAASPSYSFTNDTDTGIYRSASGLHLAAGGVSELLVATNRIEVQNTNFLEVPAGSEAAPSFRFNVPGATGFSANTDLLRVSISGNEVVAFEDNRIYCTASRIDFASTGESYLNPSSSLVVNIDSDNNGTLAYFRVRKDTLSTGGTNLLTMAESGTLTLHQYGAGTLSTDGSGNVSASDARLKTVLDREVVGRNNVMALNPVWYSWKEGNIRNQQTDIPELGFTAQGVAEVIPEAAPGTDETVPVRNYHDRAIIASLVKHNQELETRLATLEAMLLNQ